MEVLGDSDASSASPGLSSGFAISPEQQEVVLTARELLMHYAGERVIEPWEGRPTTLREKARFIGHVLTGRRHALLPEYPSIFWRSTTFYLTRRLVLQSRWGHQWEELSHELHYDAEHDTVVQETLTHEAHPLLLELPGYNLIAWNRRLEKHRDLLKPIRKAAVIAALHDQLQAIREKRETIRATSERVG